MSTIAKKKQLKIMTISTPPQETAHILTYLANSIKPVNFRQLVGPNFENDEERKLAQKHYLICTVEHLLDKAKNEGYDLCKRNGSIHIYNGAFWEMSGDDDLKNLLGITAERMGADKFMARHYKFRDSLFSQFLASGGFQSAPRSKETVLINLQNGTYEIGKKSQQLRLHCKNDFLTYQLPFTYDPTAKAPLFSHYLDTVLPDIKMQNILAEYIGYVFTRGLKLEKVLLLYGSGSNGKSVFFEVINALLGQQNVSNYTLQSLTDPVYRAKLANKLLNYGSEIKGSTESDVFKQLASGEPIEAKALYKDPFTMTEYAKLMFNCNRLPSEVEHTEAFFRRFLIVPFDVTITDDQKDPELPIKIIRKELSGVFNWVLQGLNRLLTTKRFTESEKVQEVINKYRKESDSVALFVDESNYKASTYTIPLQILYQEYKLYCTISGYNPVSQRKFGERLKVNKVEVVRKGIGMVALLEKPVEYITP